MGQSLGKRIRPKRKQSTKMGENPFADGTCRMISTERKKKKNKDQAFAEWVPTLPATGTYAVYVSYQTLPNSVSDAKYLVFHNGGVTEFKVNQKDRRRNLGIPRHL